MFSSFAYLAFRALLGLLVRSRRGPDVKDIELMILRHELGLFAARSTARLSGRLIARFSLPRRVTCRVRRTRRGS